jgi:hypothetical protein
MPQDASMEFSSTIEAKLPLTRFSKATLQTESKQRVRDADYTAKWKVIHWKTVNASAFLRTNPCWSDVTGTYRTRAMMLAGSRFQHCEL